MAKKATAKKTTSKASQLNETGNRSGDRRQESVPVAEEKRTTQRRRLIDPTTCERDYSQEEIEFMQAMDEYKRTSGRMFPTCSEILEVLNEMGYRRLTADQLTHEKQSQESDLTETAAAEIESEIESELESISKF